MFFEKFLLLVLIGVFSASQCLYFVKDECPPNEEYLICGTACPANCSNLSSPDICSDKCVEGCFCNPGLVRNDDGLCVKPELCPGNTSNVSVCGENEEFISCGSACPATCSQPDPEVCIQVCRTGCFCKPGYVREDASSKCVLLENCPDDSKFSDKCPPNEEYQICGSACPANCSDLRGDQVCGDQCVEGCFCSPGLVRDDNGTCVKPDQCVNIKTAVCGDNEELLDCGTACPPTCSQPEPDICIQVCKTGCFCKGGYVRDETSGTCVPEDQCPAELETCFNKDEVYDPCNAGCQPTCTDPLPLCNKMCKGGCVCSPGLVRNDAGECVGVETCSKK